MKPAPAPFAYWPDTPLPVPPVLTTPGAWHLEDDVSMVFVESAIDWRSIELPSELWMRQLLTLDLAAHDDLAAFVTDYGMLWRHRPKPEVEGVRDLEELTADLRVFRNVARLLLAVVGNSDVHKIVHLEDDGSGLAATIQRQEPDPARMRWAAHEVNRQLTSMHPLIAAPPATGDSDRDITLAGVLAVQMFNFAVMRPHVAKCAWCGDAFLYQEGRTKYGGHRTGKGVLYCSHDHAMRRARKNYLEKSRTQKAKEAEDDARRLKQKGGEKT